jgi:hypothetical protein
MIRKLTAKDLAQISKNQNNNYSTPQIKGMLINKNYCNIGYFHNQVLQSYVFASISDNIDII